MPPWSTGSDLRPIGVRGNHADHYTTGPGKKKLFFNSQNYKKVNLKIQKNFKSLKK